MAGPEGRLSSPGAGICLAGGPVMQVVGPFLRKGDDRQRIPVTEKATRLFLWRVRLRLFPMRGVLCPPEVGSHRLSGGSLLFSGEAGKRVGHARTPRVTRVLIR